MADITDQVLKARSSRVCVIAGPGCRKTTGILIPKAKQLLANEAVDPDSVLILTFSRLSAKDLKNKVKELDRTPRASTVHSFCLSFLLSEDNHDIRSRIESILMDFEKEPLLSDLKQTFPNVKRPDLRKQLSRFSAGWATHPHDEVFEKTKAEQDFKSALTNWLSEHEAAMMEEIVYYAVDLARQLPNAAFLTAPQFVLVDEFQDLNRLEQEFIECLAGTAKLLIVVGDPDQSIYSFKYAHPSGIVDFGKSPGVDQFTSAVSWRCPKSVIKYANSLLVQAEPARTALLAPAPNAIEGEVHFIRRDYQDEEFSYVLNAAAQKLKTDSATNVLILAPRRKLGRDFAEFAEANKKAAGIGEEIHFRFTAKHDFNPAERDAVLLFSLLGRPSSLLHRRSYLGLPDDNHYAAEFVELKSKYGSLAKALDQASGEDFPKNKKRIRDLCSRIGKLKSFLEAHVDDDLDAIFSLVFPETNPDLTELRAIFTSLREEGDTASSLHRRFVDYIQNLPDDDKTVRVMTLIGSKGLDANHVFILGCNAGSMPGERWSEHVSDDEHKREQRRLLYVGFTRAKKSLYVSWSRSIPFSQSKGQVTPGVRTITHNGSRYAQVGICEFLQDLRVPWE